MQERVDIVRAARVLDIVQNRGVNAAAVINSAPCAGLHVKRVPELPSSIAHIERLGDTISASAQPDGSLDAYKTISYH